MTFKHDTFISPMTWRYGSNEMRHIWSELHKRRQMRQVWLALATAQHDAGLVNEEQLADLRQQVNAVDIPRALEIERETRHDVMAEIRCYAEQCPVGGGIIHWGATSADVNDNVTALRLRQSLQLLLRRQEALLEVVAAKITQYADLPVMAHTHIQPAEPTTLGYRFAGYGQDLLELLFALRLLAGEIRGKGFKGAVGTQASFADMLAGAPMGPMELEQRAMEVLELPYFMVTTQTVSRQQDLQVQQLLARLAATLHKMAYDFRILQSPPFGEWAEPFGQKQVGSSAMPFKRNPINMENVCSLARLVASLTIAAWENASQAILERSLDDSANRRLFQPESLLATDEMLRRMTRVLAEMRIDQEATARNLERYGPFAATERVLMALVQGGVDRQEGHEWLRQHSVAAWQRLQESGENPLPVLLAADRQIAAVLPPAQLAALMDVSGHTGTAALRANLVADAISQALAS
jgi:adenylosuccinate lyase